jgi:hypothetical protein
MKLPEPEYTFYIGAGRYRAFSKKQMVALVAQGKLEERKRIVEALRAKHEAAKHIHNHYACLAREIEEGEL